MKRKFINFLSVSSVLIAMLSVASCSDDNEPKPQPEPEASSLIVGEWYLNISNSYKTSWEVTCFREDGTFDYEVVISSLSSMVNNRSKGTSTYHVDGNIYTGIYEISGVTQTVRNRIAYIDDYSLRFISMDGTGSDLTYSRIVDSRTINIGSTEKVSINDSNFSGAVFYKSSEPKIATVDSNGNVTGVSQGTAYITVRSSIGAVVVRVTVNDPEHEFNELDKYIGMTRDEIIALHGDKYYGLTSSIGYFMSNGIESQRDFFFNRHNKCSYVASTFWDLSYMDKFNAYLKSKYKVVTDNDERVTCLGANDKFDFWVFSYKPTQQIVYEKYLDMFDLCDEFIYNDIYYIAEQTGMTITNTILDRGYFFIYWGEDDFYTDCYIRFDKTTKMPTSISFTCNKSVTVAQAETRIKEFYPVYLDTQESYTEYNDWYSHNPVITVSAEEFYGSTNIDYMAIYR